MQYHPPPQMKRLGPKLNIFVLKSYKQLAACIQTDKLPNPSLHMTYAKTSLVCLCIYVQYQMQPLLCSFYNYAHPPSP